MINFFIEANFNLKRKKHIKKLIDFMLIKENVKIKYINFIFCDDNFLLKINNKFLDHDFYTDVISFNYSSSQIEGEIYISISRVLDNSRTYNTDENVELIRVIVHGVLHLCGYNDKNYGEKKSMKLKEDEYINKYFNNFVPRGT
ncbi:MAG: rRNA maturation RNase YbeY [Flavobacteriales bacterium TMED288]|nr:rRNA maturation RNase YbeY [Flavobacteriales bacterium]RPG53029.1 MAG: rRNA maturation RNase YbeY [Flavobacteriales bacterium TMED288]|tara:strand:- start:7013 stop:7444 length:432 start_codon:yes stop_codon:yes gene_type:complete